MEPDNEAHGVEPFSMVFHVPRPAQIGGGEQHRLRLADDKEAIRTVNNSERWEAVQMYDGKLGTTLALIAFNDPISGQRLGREAGRWAENLEQAPRADRGARSDGTTSKNGEQQRWKKPRRESVRA